MTTVANLTLLELEKLVHTIRRTIKDVRRPENADFDELHKQFAETSAGTLMWVGFFYFFLQSGHNIPDYHDLRVTELIYDVQGSYLEMEGTVQQMLKDDYSGRVSRLISRRNAMIQRSYENLKQRLDAIAISNMDLNEILLSIPLYKLPGRPSNEPHIIITEEYETDASLSPTTLSEHADLESVDGRSMESQSQSNIDLVNISSLHTLCLDCLVHVSFITTSKARKLAGLLERWSIGLFDKVPVTLDSLLLAKDNSNKNLRQFILRTLVHIAIAEERIFQMIWNTAGFPQYPYKDELVKSQQRMLKKEEKKSILDVDENLHGATHKHRSALHLMLNHSELTDFALQRWDELLELEVEDNTEEDLDEEQHTSVDCELDEIEYLIESLFDVSSSIRAARHSHILEVQKSAQILQQEKSPTELNKTKNEVETPAWRTDSRKDESGDLLKMQEVQRKERLGARDSSVRSKLIKDNHSSSDDLEPPIRLYRP